MTEPYAKPPVIGVTLDSEEGGGFAESPWYAVRQNYLSCLEDMGAAPIALPHLVALAETYLDILDGLMVTGGGFDVPAELFGEEIRSDTIRLKPARTAFEAAVMRGALERDMPVLGICGGHQLLAALTGGKLVQHIPDEIENPLEHAVSKNTEITGKAWATHPISIAPDSQLAEIVGATVQRVNSSHHQSVRSVAEPMRVSAQSADGVVEAVELTNKTFAIGVQWHPEYQQADCDTRLLKAFVDAASVYRQQK